jgi:glutaredoxin
LNLTMRHAARTRRLPQRVLWIALVLLAAGSSANAAPNGGEAKALAMHLKAVGAILYGAWWCPHCNHQKELFGNEASGDLPYVECDRDDIGRKRCEAAQIKGYPTWDLNGERRLGVLSLEELEQWSRFSPQLKAAQP